MKKKLLALLENYQLKHPDENISALVDFLNQSENPFLRSNLTGHVTCSAFIINNDKNSALLIFHNKLQKWLQPGGHMDEDESVFDTAIREAKEELGIDDVSIIDTSIFDIDIHIIPENIKKQEPEHIHYDIRILSTTNNQNINLDLNEVQAYQWATFENLKSSPDTSLVRMINKLS